MTSARRRLAELQTAFILLTRFPVGRTRDDGPTIYEACWAFPICGLAVGAFAWAAFVVALWIGLPASAAAMLSIGAGLLASGGFHEDGLADVADGFGGGWDREAKLRIMRDSRIGSYGVLALVVVIGAKASAIVVVGEGAGLIGFLALAAASRAGLAVITSVLPPARPDGLGQSMASPIEAWRLLLGILIAVIVAAPLGLLAMGMLAGVSVAGLGVALLAKRQIDGQTGDVLGAAQVVSETTGWLVLAAMLS